MSSWIPSWLWWGASGPKPHMKPTDAVHDPTLRNRFAHFLDNNDPPKSFRAAEVAQDLRVKELANLGYETWEEALPAIIELAFEFRELGSCEILKRGKVLGEDVQADDIEGGIRIRRIDA